MAHDRSPPPIHRNLLQLLRASTTASHSVTLFGARIESRIKHHAASSTAVCAIRQCKRIR
jgi:hypothetical protein